MSKLLRFAVTFELGLTLVDLVAHPSWMPSHSVQIACCLGAGVVVQELIDLFRE